MTEPAPRKERVLDALKEIIQDLSGISVADLDAQATFLELGFDSLFLTQANSAFKKKFKVKLSVRQLLEKYSRLDTLAAYIDEKLPADAFPPPASTVSSQESVGSGQLHTSPNLPISQSLNLPTPGLSVPQSTIEKVIQDQLQTMQQLMAQQLAILAGGSVPAPAINQQPATSNQQPATAPAQSSDTNGTVHQAVTEATQKPMVDKTSPWQPVQAGEDGKLPPKQQAHLKKLIETTIARCPKSKAQTQKHRAHLADPRTVQGYKKAWKEMVFPIIADRSKGSKVWDIDGNEYIDLMGGYGVNLLGHSPDFISEAAKAQIDRGVEIGPQNRLAGEVAQMVCEMTGMDRAAMCNTGSEAILAAIRIARTITGNDRIAMFKTHYHGIFNEVLAKGLEIGGKKKTMPIAPGIPGFAVENTLMLDYGEQKALDDIRAHADELALVMVESVRSRDPEKRPHEFIKALRALTEELGIPLMFDEIVTGFRAGPGGAQEYYGVQADLASYGKIIGGGYPIGVIAGKKEYMDALDGGFWQFGDDSAPEADMTWFAGTFVRHPLAMATAHATLTHLKENPNLQKELNEKTAVFAKTLNDYFEQTKAPIYITHFASWFMVKFKPYQEYSPLMFWHLRNRGILTYEGRPAFFTAAHTDEDFGRIIQAFKESAAEMQNNGFFPGGPVRDPNEPYDIPMTEGQQEIWLATRFGMDASRAYNLASTLRIKGDLQVDKLEEALLKLIQRHESLRAVPNEDGLSQKVIPVKAYELLQYDLSDRTVEIQETQVEELKHEEVITPFDLENGPLTRARLIKLNDKEHVFVFTAHHLIADGWSCGLILKDLAKLYTAVSTSTPADLNDVMQLSEWAELQAETVGSEEHEDAKAYWLEEFKGDVPVLELPTDRPRPAVKTYLAKRITVVVDKDEMAAYAKVASEQGVTLFTYLMGAFDVLLHRITGQDDIVVGFSLAGQSNLSGQDLVAHAVNFLPIRAQMQPQMPFPDLLNLLRGKIFDAVEYQDYPFGALIKNLKLERDRSRLPLMSVAFNLDPSGSGVQIPGLDVEAGSVPRQYENFDIFFNVAELANRYEIQVTANQDLFNPDTIERYIDSYLTILRSTAANPAQTTGRIPLLTDAEMGKLLVDWNTSDQTYEQHYSLIELFEQQVEKFGERTAVTYNSHSISYNELNQKANQLAHHLRSMGVGHETLVGLSLERSIDIVTGILGIMKAGGAYVPLDPANPASRLVHIVAETNMPVIITQSGLMQDLPTMGAEIVLLDSEWDTIAQQSSSNPELATTADSLAYVIFTSGSTGKPKGVMVDHANVVRLFTATQDWYNFTEQDVWTMFHSYAFDFSVWELWGALLYGGRLVMVPYLVSRSPEAFYELIHREKVTILNQTPSAFRQFIQAEEIVKEKLDFSLRYIIFGGEALELESLRPWFNRHGDQSPQLVNMYGITETTVHVTYRPINMADVEAGLGSVIGVPIPDLQLYILDEQMQPVPIGVPGELYVGGSGVARGYLNRPDLTAERFLDFDAVSAQWQVKTSSPSKLYKTGDLGRFLPNRDVEYLGRIDNQVQIRGFRVELGEIENAVAQHESVHEAVVIVREDNPGEQEVTAYIVAAQDGEENIGTDEASNEHKAMWLEKWAAIYESGRASKAQGHISGEVVNDLAILDQLSEQEDFEQELAEFQGQTFDRVMALKPKRVLEIGCGTGQNLIKIAPEVDYFLGTDYAPFAIEEVQQYLDRDDVNLPHVDLMVREGNDFTGIEPNVFDTVLILSVSQYFPAPEYFKQVIEGSVKAAKPGGVVYISDVQSFAHLETHHAADQLFRSPDGMTRDELQGIVARRVANEDELVVDPNYFSALQMLLPEISRIEFKMRRGHVLNETTKFHYDVFLYIAPQEETAVFPTWHNWQAEAFTLDKVRSLLANDKPELLCLTGVENGRIQTEVAVCNMLHDIDSPETVGAIKEALRHISPTGIDPEALWSLGEELGYDVDVRWTENQPNGTMDVVFVQPRAASAPALVVPPAAQGEILGQSWRDYSNKPMLKAMSSQLIPELRESLKNKLPDYMMPAHIIVMDSIPLTNNGKVNRKALPVPTRSRAAVEDNQLVAPRNEIERTIAEIWTAILNLPEIGVHDNFFELGGHSLLAVQIMIRINQAFDVELALGTLFQMPTVAELANGIAAMQYVAKSESVLDEVESDEQESFVF